MKRIILMGGRPWETPDKGENFVKVLFRYFPDEVNLAFCIFAQPESDWEATIERNIKMFNKFSGHLKLTTKTLTQQNFEGVSKWADVVYLPGGSPFVLIEKLAAVGDLKKLWDGKVIAGSSAAADLFCKSFAYLQDRTTFGEGLDWINVSCIPHWRDDFENYTQKDWDWAEQESLKRYPELPVLTIPEGEFVELSIN